MARGGRDVVGRRQGVRREQMTAVPLHRHWTTAHGERERRHGRRLQAMRPPAVMGMLVLQPQFDGATTVAGESWNHGLASCEAPTCWRGHVLHLQPKKLEALSGCAGTIARWSCKVMPLLAGRGNRVRSELDP